MNYKLYQLLLPVGMLLLSVVTSAQEFVAVDKAKASEIIQSISAASRQIKTLECGFIENKTVHVLSEVSVSEGKMYYKKPNSMRWEYTRPDPYCFVVSNGKSVLKKNGKTDRGNGAKIFGEISKMILACINGEKLVDESKFIPAYTLNGDIFRITLTPRSSRISQVISRLVMEFSLKQSTIRSLELVQKNDVTQIEFKDRKLNKPIAEKMFDL